MERGEILVLKNYFQIGKVQQHHHFMEACVAAYNIEWECWNYTIIGF